MHKSRNFDGNSVKILSIHKKTQSCYVFNYWTVNSNYTWVDFCASIYGRDLQHGRCAAKTYDMSHRVVYTTCRMSYI